jgi:hypothetical protein
VSVRHVAFLIKALLVCVLERIFSFFPSLSVTPGELIQHSNFRAMGAEILRPNMLALLADAYRWSGQIEAGLGALEEALVTAEQHAERFYEAELHRLKGELFLRQWREAGTNPAPSDRQPRRPPVARLLAGHPSRGKRKPASRAPSRGVRGP